jgi:leader peptidase (prepilin peptidase)/N-methyltransferase
MNDQVVVASLAIAGGAFGFLADRLSVRWPAHEPDYQPRPFDWRTVVAVGVGAVVGGGLVARWWDQQGFIFLVIVMAALLVLFATDLDQRVLPDWVTLPLIPVTAAALLFGFSPLLADKALGAASGVAAAILAPAFLFVSNRLFPGTGQLGDGDVKLAVSLGLLCGISLLITGLLIASIAFAVVLLTLIAIRKLTFKSLVPFGPVLILAAFVAVLVG